MRRVVSVIAALCAPSTIACKDKQQTPAATHDATAEVATTASGDAAAAQTMPAADAAGPAVARRPERKVFSLGDNLLGAHRAVGTDLVVDATSIGFARYVRFNMPVARWKLGAAAHGHRVALASKGGPLEVPLTEAQATTAKGIALELVGAPDKEPSKRTVKIGGRKAGTIEVVPGRVWHALDVAPGLLAAGENMIVIEGGEVALTGLRVYTDATRIDADMTPLTHATWDAAARALALDDGAALAWYVHVPLDAHLVADVPGDCRVEVSARTDDGTRAGGLLGGGTGHVDLSPVGDRAVRLELLARDCPKATLADPWITVPGAPLAEAPAGPPPKYIVIWVMDALRADRVRPFTPGARAEVPNFEKLAATGAVFRQFYVGGNESQTSHSTVWTGTYPAVHNVRLAGDGGNWKIPNKLTVLGEMVKAAGLTPIGVTGNGFVTEAGGYARGFAEFRNMMREKGMINGVLFGEKVVNAALARLDARKADPTLLFLGTVDTHGPWIARKPWMERYDASNPQPYTGPFQDHGTMRELGIKKGEMGCSLVPAPRDILRLRAIYDSAVSYHDARLGDLVAGLQRMGIYDETMIILTADHGEELFEESRCGHGGSLRETLVRVPLLVHYPPRVAAAVVDEGAEGVDIMPTILDALGSDRPAQLQGESLLPRAAGVDRGWPRPSYASQFEYAHAMRVARWKLKVGKRGVPVLLDMVADPDERTDIKDDNPTARRLVTDALGLFLATRARWNKQSMGVVTNLVPGAAEKLEALAP
ncbi:MAG TPA: sulfatase [Kofleriaceae bacterium]|nr:sulfatase [Kofleriaceae bacterium]